MKTIRKVLIILAAIALITPFVSTSSQPVQAASDYQLGSVSGKWTAVSGGSSVTGLNTNEIRWGTPAEWGGKKSGLGFYGEGAQTFGEGETFVLGRLTHFNWPINSGTAANGATLEITLNFVTPAIQAQTFSYAFSVDETPNTNKLKDCPSFQQSQTPCDDLITFPNSYGQHTFTIGDKIYTLKIVGFVSSPQGGTPVSRFITEEEKNNDAYLVGILSSVLVEKPAITLTKKTNNTDVPAAPGPELTAGSSVTWQYVVQNTGNVALTNVSVSDSPAVTISCPSTTLQPGDLMTCTASGTAIEGQFENTATVTGTYSGGNISASDSSWYVGKPSADLAITKTDSPDPVSRGGSLTYTLTITNHGPSAAANVTVNDSLPSGLQDPQYSTNGGSTWSTWTGSYAVGNLAANSSQQILVRATVADSASGTLSNSASVSSTTPDPDKTNNEASTTTQVEVPTNTPEPTATNTPLPTATNTPEPTATNTPLPTATNTPEPTATNTPLPTATNTPEPTATNTPLPTATATNIPQPTATATSIPQPTETATNVPQPTATATNIPQPTATATNVPQPTATNVPLPTATSVAPTAVAPFIPLTGITETPTATPVTPTPTATLLPTTQESTLSPTVPPTFAPPAATAQVLIPVTGADLSAQQTSTQRTTNWVALGGFLAGLGLVLTALFRRH